MTERQAAKKLFKLFKKHSKHSVVSEKGLRKMAKFFGSVPLDKRGRVFTIFLFMLDEAEYAYDVSQFGGEG